jgi:cytochrome d ubiquinol oxidase subunit I
LAAVMVAFGTLLSSFWILATNSWMQTPQGYTMVNGRFEPANWFAIIFNPSFPYRLAHNVTAFYITTAFVVLGVSAYLLRRNKSAEEARLMMRMALDLLIVLVPLQIVLGDMHGLNTLHYQPAKLAAIEGRYDTVKPTPLTLFGIPDDKNATMRDAIEIPDLGSLILTHSWNGVVRGLKEWPRKDWPPVAPPFYAFRIMVGIALIMLFVVVAGQVLRLGGHVYKSTWFLRLCQCTIPIGFIAVIAGWVTTEVGRQPWTVYGLLRTSDSVSPSLTGTDVAISLALYMVVYLIMFPTGIAFMAGLIRRGPHDADFHPDAIEGGRPDLPFGSIDGQGAPIRTGED